VLCHTDSSLMKFSVQGIHQVTELIITLRRKVVQKEDFTGNRILHRVTEIANLVDHQWDLLNIVWGVVCVPPTLLVHFGGELFLNPYNHQRSGVLRSST